MATAPADPATGPQSSGKKVQEQLDGMEETLRQMQEASQFQFEGLLEEHVNLKRDMARLCEGMRQEIQKGQQGSAIAQQRLEGLAQDIAGSFAQAGQAAQTGNPTSGSPEHVQQIVHRERRELQSWMEEQWRDLRQAVIKKQHESDKLFHVGNESIVLRLDQLDEGLASACDVMAVPWSSTSVAREEEVTKALPSVRRIMTKGAVSLGADSEAYINARRWLQKTEHESTTRMEFVSIALIVINCIFVVVDSMNRGNGHHHPGGLFYIVDTAFVVAFSLELMARLCIEGQGFYRGRSRWWNLFDTAVVLVDLLRLPMDFEFTPRTARLVRLIRLVRVLRMFRMSPYVVSLRLFIASISQFLPFMVYNVAVQAALAFVTSLLLTYDVEQFFVEAEDTHPFYNDLVEQHGTLLRSMWTLATIGFGGTLLDDALGPLRAVGGSGSTCFLVWFFFSRVLVFAGLSAAVSALLLVKPNILRKEKDYQLGSATSPVQLLRKAFLAECNCPVQVTLAELEALLQTGKYDKTIAEMDLDRAAVLGLFQLLDIEQDGVVVTEALLNSMANIRDHVDMVTLMYENKRISNQLMDLGKMVLSTHDMAKERAEQLQKEAALRHVGSHSHDNLLV